MATAVSSVELAASTGVAVPLRTGQRLCLVNTFGSQVVDTWALCTEEPDEFMSMEHTRRMNGHLHPVVGDVFWSNRRNPMLTFEEDSFPGTHDTIVACCDRWLYAHYGCADGHANCYDNYLGALAHLGVQRNTVPNPLNLWMNVPVEGNVVSVSTPLSRPGDHVVFRADRDVTMVFSTCPMDVAPSAGAAAINGPDCQPRPVHYSVY
ncbi:MAG: urea carboxylase-associated family protein [Pseudomonadota bacterium]